MSEPKNHKNKKSCLWCEHFTLKVMLNGYHGTCDEKDCFVRFDENCEFFKRREDER